MELNREQIIKELEGVAKFTTCPSYIKAALSLIKELNEENEDLKAQCRYYAEAYHSVKADAVRKMQEKLIRGAFCSACGVDYSHHIIQIAKEMLEGSHGT